jgi:hypothetical protein
VDGRRCVDLDDGHPEWAEAAMERAGRAGVVGFDAGCEAREKATMIQIRGGRVCSGRGRGKRRWGSGVDGTEVRK